MSDLAIFSADDANRIGEGHLPGLIGLDFKEIEHGRVVAELAVKNDTKRPTIFFMPPL